MLDFDFFNQRKSVHRALANRMNTACMDDLRHQDRKNSRSMFSVVVWLVPLKNGKTPSYTVSVPCVSKDISVEGLSLLHTAAVTDKDVLVVLPGEQGHTFLMCEVEHSSDLGYGFHQIGLQPKKVVNPSNAEQKTWQKRCEDFAPAVAPA